MLNKKEASELTNSLPKVDQLVRMAASEGRTETVVFDLTEKDKSLLTELGYRIEVLSDASSNGIAINRIKINWQ